MNTPTPSQLEILQHALGLDQFGQPPKGRKPCDDDDFPNCYRNRFVTDPESPNGQECEALIRLGWMAKPSRQPNFIGGMTNYFVTQAGFDLVKSASPQPPKLSRSKQRYLEFLDVADLFKDFRAYLRYLERERKRASLQTQS